ncbi:hypothetical protein HOC35_05005, partial [Candidatus Woesearchaeota archaeon]|nr:hypothetical protein [Candidatus Woesearchaeota archaeon]
MDNNTDNHEKKEENTPIKDDSNEQIKETTTQEENNKQDVKQKHALHNHHQKHSEESKPKEDSEIDLKKIFNTDNIKKGFNKIKKSFSLKKKHQVHGDNYKNEKSNESISTIEFIIKHKTILLLLIPIILSIFLRIQPVYLPAADDWATNNVEGYYKNQIAQQISQQYPNLPETNKNLLIEGEYNKFLKENKDSMKAQIEANAQQMRTQFQDDSGQTYLLAIDPWFWYRLTENYLDHGYDYDLEVDGRYYNNHRLAPFLEEDLEVTGSTSKAQEFQVIVQSFLYKVWRVFDSDVSLLKIAFLTPLIIATLSIIPIFFLVRKIAGDLGGLVAGTILAINPFGLTRTVAGFADTDAFNFLFPIVIFGFLVLAIDHKKITQRIIYSALAGLSIGLYSFSWGGWMFMVSFSIFFLLGIIAFKLIKMIWNKKIKLNKFKEIGTVFVSFLIFSGISTLITGRFSYFINAPKGIIKFIQLKAVATKTIWPNVYTTVAELNPGNIGNIFSTIGGKLALLFTLLGIILSFYAYKKIKRDDAFLIGGSFLWFVFIIYLKDSFSSITKFILILGLPIIIKFLFVIFKEIKEDKENVEERYNIIFPLMFTIYLFGTMFSLSRGVRFSLLLIPAYAICFGAFAGIATKKLAELIKNTLNLNKTITYIILIIILGIIVLQPISAAKNVVGSQVPSMNDQWYEALIKIKEDSKEDA